MTGTIPADQYAGARPLPDPGGEGREDARLVALHDYEILDTPPDGSFDRIAELAAWLLDVPIAIVSLVDEDRIWFKSQVGLGDVREIPRDPGLCASAIMDADVYVVEDARVDPRTLANPLVTGAMGLQFYAAAPLTTADEHSLGTLCVIDFEPRTLTSAQQSLLRTLADVVMDEMDLRLAVRKAVAAERSQRRRAEDAVRRLTVLARASTAVMGAALSPEAELCALAQAVVPELADGCFVYLLDRPVDFDEPRLEAPVLVSRVAGAIAQVFDSDMALPARGLRLPDDHPVAVAVRTRSVVHVEVAHDEPTRTMSDPGVGDWREAVGAHSVVAVPLAAGRRFLAVIVFIVGRDRPPFDAEDVALMEALGDRVDAALHHGVLYQRTRYAALALQESLLTDPLAPDDLEIAVRYRPAVKGDTVGGDWYDTFFLSDGSIALVVGDVAGHDIHAAATMGQIRNILRGVAGESADAPGPVLDALDRGLERLRITDLTSLILARVEGPEGGPHQLRWASAGHPPPLLILADGGARFLEGATGLLLGVDSAVKHVDAVEALPRGSTVVLFTDGLIERRDVGLDESLASLAERAAALASLGIEELCARLVEDAPPDDDLALLAVRIPSIA